MRLMPEDERTDLRDTLHGYHPAAPDLVRAAVADAQAARWTTGTEADRARRRAAEAVLPLARRLVDAETEYAALRRAVARVLHALDDGDEVTTADITDEVTRAGLSVRAELEELADLARAETEASR